MIFSWLKNRRRRKLLARPFSPQWLEWLDSNVRLYALLPKAYQAKLRNLVKIFVAEKNFEGCGGLELSDENRVTIAAGASLLVLGIESNYYFDRVRTILVYPDMYLHPQRRQAGSVVIENDMAMLGEHHHDGPIILSWKHVLEGGRNPHNGQNLVLHEFAHHLDGLAGAMDGAPPLGSRQETRDWRRVTDAEYHRLSRMSRQGQPTLLDWYGATDRAEFFAVTTECFFERPKAMRDWHPDLYDIFCEFFQQNPACWKTA